MGAGRPVLVLTGDVMNLNGPLAEFYIFHEFPDMPFIYSRTSCAHPDALYLYDFGQYPEIFSATAMMEAQFRAARDHLEHEIAIRDKQLASDLFSTASPLVFEESGTLPLVEFAFFRRFIKEREQMFRFSKSQAIAQLRERLLDYPEAILTQEPKNGSH